MPVQDRRTTLSPAPEHFRSVVDLIRECGTHKYRGPTVQSIFIIHGFFISKYAPSLKFTDAPNFTLTVLSWSFMDMHRMVKTMTGPRCMFPAKAEKGDTLSSCFSSHIANDCPFCGIFSAIFFAIPFFLFVCFLIFLFKIDPRHRAQSCLVIPSAKNIVMTVMEEISASDMLHLGIGYSVVGCEFSVSESTIYVK